LPSFAKCVGWQGNPPGDFRMNFREILVIFVFAKTKNVDFRENFWENECYFLKNFGKRQKFLAKNLKFS
jgi:hypothetical protein